MDDYPERFKIYGVLTLIQKNPIFRFNKMCC